SGPLGISTSLTIRTSLNAPRRKRPARRSRSSCLGRIFSLAWRADPRGFVLARAGLQEAARRRAEQARWALDTARVGVMAEVIAKPTFTRADLVEVLAPQIPYDQ